MEIETRYCCWGVFRKDTPVTASLWPRSLHMAVYDTRSHSTMSLSAPPLTSVTPSASKHRLVIMVRWPFKVATNVSFR